MNRTADLMPTLNGPGHAAVDGLANVNPVLSRV